MIHNIAIVPLLLVLTSKYCLKNLYDFPSFKQSTAVCSQKFFCVPPGPAYKGLILIKIAWPMAQAYDWLAFTYKLIHFQ